ncbi:MAG: glycoside hydrolase family 127 protein [Verrucomicrobiales bacterium]|nr:glycoside hydrolase family 127 protein [Verrucomicrobiales bacterium]
MNRTAPFASRIALVLLVAAAAPAQGQTSPLVKLRAVAFTEVRFADRFWRPRLDTNRLVTIPVNFENLEKAGNLQNFRLAARRATNGYQGPVFMDSDAYKAMEAAAWSLATHPDPALEKQLDELIATLAAAQLPDGYLNTFFTVKRPDRRWKDLRDAHELYCAGHLFEAAVAHFQATGKRTFLDVACKLADYIDSVFGPPPKWLGYCGHPEIELALIKLWRVTGQQRYFDLARFFIENRGRGVFAGERKTPDPNYDPSYYQDDVPIFDHDRIKGHAVRAAYLMAGVTDLAAETRDERLLRMLDRVWRNTIERNVYITGGIGPSAHNEGFTTDYDLPNLTAYQETCATIALALWAHRMALLYGDARYADALERALYNGVLAGVAQDGRTFFYVNPLESRGDHHRKPWYGCACCPPNIARILASLGGYVAATGPNALWINLYAQGQLDAALEGERVRWRVTTDYPWDGRVTLQTQLPGPRSFQLRLRVPGWCEGATVALNGKPVAEPTIERGYIVLDREWHNGDTVTLNFPMPVRRIVAHPKVKADHGLVALQRGPIVYCIEQCDQTAPLDRLYLPLEAELVAVAQPLLFGGVTVLRGQARLIPELNWDGHLYRALPGLRTVELTAVP